MTSSTGATKGEGSGMRLSRGTTRANRASESFTKSVARWGLWLVALVSVATVVALSATLDIPSAKRPVSASIVVSLGLGLVGSLSFATFYYREGDRPMPRKS